MSIGQNIKRFRKEKGYTQRELADASGLSEATISYYIRKIKMPGVKALINIAYALNCTIDELVDFGEHIDG